MLYEIVNEFPNSILFDNDEVCISIYQPTSRDIKKDKLVFKNQLQKVKSSLLKDYKEAEVEVIMRPLHMIEQDLNFWIQTNDAIAILMNRKHCVVYNLFRTIKEFTSVSNSFHIKPLLRVYQSTDKYYVLGVNRQTFKLFYGDRYEFRELVFPKNIDITIEQVLGDQYRDYGRGQVRSNQSGAGMYSYGPGSKNESIEVDIEKYFRYIDKFIHDNYSKPANAPLVLVCLDEYYGVFKKITKNTYLISKHINKDFMALTKDDLREKSWKVIETLYLKRTEDLVNKYYVSKEISAASDAIGEIVQEVKNNRIEIVLIESDKVILGDFNKENELLELGDEYSYDVLDKIAELVLAYGGEVVMLPKDKMPSNTGVAAIYRY